VSGPERQIPTGFWLVLGLVIAFVVVAVCAVGISVDARSASSPTSSTSIRSTP